ncbi:MAG: hemolysin family protein [Oligoflexales bacterium]
MTANGDISVPLFSIAACLCFSAFFSASETAITSLGHLKAKHMLESDPKAYRHLRLWVSEPGVILTTILVFNNVVNILASALATQLASVYFENAAIGVVTGVMTLLVLIIGEIVPKSFAKTHAEMVAPRALAFVVVMYYLSWPLIRLLSGGAESAIRFLSGGKSTSTPLMTEEELEFIVHEGGRTGIIGDLKKNIIDGAFEFDETRVRQIMTPRPDIIAFDIETSFEDMLAMTIQTGMSRFPVYRGSIDHMRGLVLAKDLLTHLGKKQKLCAADLMRETIFVPESKSTMQAFKDLKKMKNHMAIVIDEYGSTAGVVTMEDILEEFVGDIQDEFDAEPEKITKKADGIFEVAGSMNIEDFWEYFHIDEATLAEGQTGKDIDTLAGWLVLLYGDMPEKGQQVEAVHLEMEVLSVENRRIEKVRVMQKIDPSEEIAVEESSD